jgi:hypothetical protein
MTEQTTKPEGGSSDEPFEFTGADTAHADAAPEPPRADSGTSAKAREWLTQLQAMIDDVAEQAAPTIRQVGAKAAELAAVAGEKAGPIAQKAAAATESAGSKLAEKSRALADELRREPGDLAAAPETPAAATPTAASGGTSSEPSDQA